MSRRLSIPPLACLALLFCSLTHAENPKEQVVAGGSVVYGINKDGSKKTGILWLVMTQGKTVQFQSNACYKGKFTLRLEDPFGKHVTTALNPLCIPLTGSDPLIFRKETCPIVTHEFNNDGISEFNLGQSGNSWGGHYMLFTFSKDGSGKVEAMTVSKHKDDNYLHPEASSPSTKYLVDTKNGFRHSFTERGGAMTKEVYIHYRWNAKENKFEESKRVPIESRR